MNNYNNKNVDAVKAYFTKDVYDRVAKMTMNEMITLLKELESTPTWIAILKYNQERLVNAQNALITLDPFKEMTAMARYQGVMTGMLDLQEGVISLVAEAQKAAEQSDDKKEEPKEDLGGAYGKF